jgi:outer membrane protein OmpA-like peptidoglycan-associated protein
MEVQFDYASARIRPESLPALTQLALALKSPDLSGDRFVIEGHTDASGAASDNLKLSQRRAEEVRRFLQSKGVSTERLRALGMGSKEPANARDPMAAENRRVRIVNLE